MSENKKSLYILFLSDALELLPENTDQLISRTETMELGKKSIFKKGAVAKTFNSTATLPQKYEHLRVSKPDVTVGLCKKFVSMLDTDADDKIK